MKLTFVNVGYGEAILVECPDARFQDGVFVMLIDGGGAEEAEFTGNTSGRLPLAEYLERRKLGHIDLMVNTHIHEDHISGMLPAARLLRPGAFWQTLPAGFAERMHALDVSMARNMSEEKFLRALNDYQELCALAGQVFMLRAGDAGALCEGLRYRVLAPSAAEAAALNGQMQELFRTQEADGFYQKLTALDARMNNYSLMLQLDYRGTRLLLPGDTNYMGYQGIAPADMKAHLFKVGHHGQKDGASRELLHAIRPQAVVCCASSDRRYESAHPDMLAMLAEDGAALYFSDCPPVAGMELQPHHALCFTVGGDGELSAEYVS